jgi:hypothetical protein
MHDGNSIGTKNCTQVTWSRSLNIDVSFAYCFVSVLLVVSNIRLLLMVAVLSSRKWGGFDGVHLPSGLSSVSGLHLQLLMP